MKFRLFLAAAAAVVLAACNQSVPAGKTLVNCKFAEEAPDSVMFSIGEQWDTLVPVVNKKVSVLLPEAKSHLAFMMADADPIPFVSDGSTITIDTETGRAVSDNPSGPTAILQEMDAWESAFMEEFESKMAGLGEDEQNAYLEEAIDKYNEYYLGILDGNKDNVVGLMAVSSIQLDDDARMQELYRSLSEELQADDYVQQMLKLLDVKAMTGEGAMFVDFEVVQDPSNPKKSTVKLSDFVGKGKYVLVDFWASWCNPCKAEIPNIADVYKKYKGKNFDVLSIAVWDVPEDTKAAAKELGITWNQIINAQKIPTDLYGIEGIPHIILFGPDGTILKRGLRGADIEKAVKEALGK